jgi:hypothetical protein
MIKKLSCKYYDNNNVEFGVNDNIKDLFKPLTNKKNIGICLNDCCYDEGIFYFEVTDEQVKEAEIKLNASIKVVSYDDNEDKCPNSVIIRFNHSRLKNPVKVIEILEILQLLNIPFYSFDITFVILSLIRTFQKNRQTSLIYFDFTYVQ